MTATGHALGYSTSASLARALGIQQSTVSRWKKGTKPSVEHLVKISELFGVELKTLLILSGHMEGDVSPAALAAPPTPADRIIEGIDAPEEYRAHLRMFWLAREREELERLELLAEGIENAYNMLGRRDRQSFQPWVETALATELPLHVQVLRDAVDPPPNTTWILQVHPSVQGDAHDLLMKDVRQRVMVSQSVYEEDGWYYPSIHALEGSRWLLRGPSFQSLQEALDALQKMRRFYPTLKAQEVEVLHAPKEEDPS